MRPHARYVSDIDLARQVQLRSTPHRLMLFLLNLGVPGLFSRCLCELSVSFWWAGPTWSLMGSVGATSHRVKGVPLCMIEARPDRQSRRRRRAAPGPSISPASQPSSKTLRSTKKHPSRQAHTVSTPTLERDGALIFPSLQDRSALQQGHCLRRPAQRWPTKGPSSWIMELG